ncbi:hypothetical protein MHBO_002030 [Bonamia ostreae]|uniref:Large ribosomal subunit protein bL21m n=1 Tax=Bonamia ostreae TaxID=126728 RepID=A0ABV2AL47_9EUKA
MAIHKLPETEKSDLGKSTASSKFAIFALHDASRLVNRQYFVSVGDRLMLERLFDDNKRLYDIGDRVTWENVLMVGSRNATVIGQPLVSNSKVLGVVEEQTELKPIMVFKKKRRKGYNRLKEFIPKTTIVRITDVEFDFESILEKSKQFD